MIALSGGGLGVSITFLRDIIGNDNATAEWTLFCAWLCWAISYTIVLASFRTSVKATREALKQFDEKKSIDNPRSSYSKITEGLNIFGLILFFLGLLFVLVFVAVNVL